MMLIVNSPHSDEQSVSETCRYSQINDSSMFDLHTKGMNTIWGSQDEHLYVDPSQVYDRGHITILNNDLDEHDYAEVGKSDESNAFNHELHMQAYFNIYGPQNYTIAKPVNYMHTPIEIKQEVKKKNEYNDSIIQRFIKLLKSLCNSVIRYSYNDSDELPSQILNERKTFNNLSYATDCEQALKFSNRYNFGGIDPILKPLRFFEKQRLDPRNVDYIEPEDIFSFFGFGVKLKSLVI